MNSRRYQGSIICAKDTGNKDRCDVATITGRDKIIDINCPLLYRFAFLCLALFVKMQITNQPKEKRLMTSYFQMRSRISIRAYVRPSVRPLVRPSVTHELKQCKQAIFDQNYCQYKRERVLCRVSGLVTRQIRDQNDEVKCSGQRQLKKT